MRLILDVILIKNCVSTNDFTRNEYLSSGLLLNAFLAANNTYENDTDILFDLMEFVNQD